MNTLMEQWLSGVSKAYVERVRELIDLYEEEDERFETAAAELLKEYNDQETGIVRDLLVRQYLSEGRAEEGYELLEAMKAEEQAKYPAYWIEAQLLKHDPDESDRVEALCSLIPFEHLFHMDSLLLKAEMKERDGDIENVLGELTENLDRYRTSKPQTDYLTLLVNTLIFSIQVGNMEEFDRLAEQLIDVIRTQDLEQEETFIEDLTTFSTYVNEHAWPREKFKQIVETIKEKNWLKSEPEFADQLLANVEFYDIWDDHHFSRPLCALFHWLYSGKEENEEWPVKWAAVTACEKDPGAIDYAREHYPVISRLYLPEAEEILAQGKQVKKQAEEWIMEQNQFGSRGEARESLRGFMEYIDTPISSAEFDPNEFGIWCFEELEGLIRQTLTLYFLGGYESAAGMAAELSNEIEEDEDEGFLSYIEIMSLIALGKGKRVMKQLESIRAESPDEFKTIHMEASMQRYARNYRKAGKLYAKAEAPYEDQIRFMEGFLEVFGKLGKDDQAREIIEDMLEDVDFFNEDIPVNVVSKAFYYVGHVALLMDDIVHERKEHFENDTKNLKTLLLRKRPSGYVENEFARYITILCEAVLDNPEYVPFFRELLQFMEKCRTFTTQDRIIESGYSACESVQIREETGLEEELVLELTLCLQEQSLQEEEDPELELRVKEASWLAAEALRNRPQVAQELLERYPYYMKAARPYLEEILEDPEAVKKDTELYLSDLSGQSESTIREMMNGLYQNFQNETEHEKPLLS